MTEKRIAAIRAALGRCPTHMLVEYAEEALDEVERLQQVERDAIVAIKALTKGRK